MLIIIFFFYDILHKNFHMVNHPSNTTLTKLIQKLLLKSLNYWRLPMFFSGSLIRELAPTSSLIKETTERSRPPSPPELPEPILKLDDDV